MESLLELFFDVDDHCHGFFLIRQNSLFVQVKSKDG